MWWPSPRLDSPPFGTPRLGSVEWPRSRGVPAGRSLGGVPGGVFLCPLIEAGGPLSPCHRGSEGPVSVVVVPVLGPQPAPMPFSAEGRWYAAVGGVPGDETRPGEVAVFGPRFPGVATVGSRAPASWRACRGPCCCFCPVFPAGADHAWRSQRGELVGLVSPFAGGITALWYGYRTAQGWKAGGGPVSPPQTRCSRGDTAAAGERVTRKRAGDCVATRRSPSAAGRQRGHPLTGGRRWRRSAA